MKGEITMKFNENQTTTSLSNVGEESCELYSKELAKIHRKYHPQENELFDMVDDEYMKRFEKLFGVEVV